MYYKIIINNNIINYPSLYSILKNISKFFIIINPTISLNSYIIYIIIDNIENIHLLHKYKINNFIYNKVIYNIFYYYLQNFTNINHFLLIDYAFYNLMNIQIYNKLSLDNYLSIFKLNPYLKKCISNYIRSVNSKIIWIQHNNYKYLNFINNYISNYKNLVLTSNNLQILQDKSKISKNIKYIIVKISKNITYSNLNDIIKEIINIFYNKLIYNSYTLYKNIQYRFNFMILSHIYDINDILDNYVNYINFLSFNKLLN